MAQRVNYSLMSRATGAVLNSPATGAQSPSLLRQEQSADLDTHVKTGTLVSSPSSYPNAMGLGQTPEGGQQSKKEGALKKSDQAGPIAATERVGYLAGM